MKVSNYYISPKERIINHKLINISMIGMEEKEILTPPKLECMKPSTHPVWDLPDEKYQLIRKTQNFIDTAIFLQQTIETLYLEIKRRLKSNELDLHEVYNLLISYSLWEVIEKLLDDFPIDLISRNGHKLSIFHKALMPHWFWNYYNVIKKMPNNFQRTPLDILKTFELLVNHNIVCSVLELTPRKHPKTKLLYENSLVLLTRTIPKDLIKDIYDPLYHLMTRNLSPERFKKEISELLPRIPNDIKLLTEPNMMRNEIKWLMCQSPETFAKLFLKCYKINDVDDLIKLRERMETIAKLVKVKHENDGIFDQFFEEHPWKNRYFKKFLNIIIDTVDKSTVSDGESRPIFFALRNL